MNQVGVVGREEQRLIFDRVLVTRLDNLGLVVRRVRRNIDVDDSRVDLFAARTGGALITDLNRQLSGARQTRLAE